MSSSRVHPLTLALVLAVAVGCGRVGYDPILLALQDGGPGQDGLRDQVDAMVIDQQVPDAAVVPDAADGPPVPAPDMLADAPPDRAPPPPDVVPPPPDLAPPPPDVAPAASPTGPNGTATCLDYPAPRDLLADFNDGTLKLIVVDGRGGSSFHLVQTGAGELAAASSVLGACGTSIFMSFRGMAIPVGRNGHIQVLFINGPPGSDRNYDARAFSGIRLMMRSSRPLSVSLKVPDANTISDVPYDHFATSLNVTTSWRTYVLPFTTLRQAGIGTRQPALDLARLVGLELSLGDRDFELWVDTIAFYR